MSAAPRLSVLLLGASGFIGGRVLGALTAAGHSVVCGVRARDAPAARSVIYVDYMRDHAAADWAPRVAGIDVVVNAVGILRETPAHTFEALHVSAPAALFEACAAAGVKVVQISALGADEQAASRYHSTKKRADDRLAALPLRWVIVQPSLVFGEGGRSAALFARLAALPLIPLPGEGAQRIQPVHVDDLAAAIVRLVESPAHDCQRIEAVGPVPLTLRAFLAALRRALGLGAARFVRVPMSIVRAAAALGERAPGALLDRESLGMLERGNVGSPARITAVLGRTPRAVESFVAPGSAQAMAAEAQLSWLLAVLRASVAAVWIATAAVSLGLYPVADSYALLERVGLTGAAAATALYAAAALDLAFGVGIFVLRDRRWLWRAQMALIVGYSVIITVRLPEYWLHPFGPLLKNLPMLAAILLLHELEKPRFATGAPRAPAP